MTFSPRTLPDHRYRIGSPALVLMLASLVVKSDACAKKINSFDSARNSTVVKTAFALPSIGKRARVPRKVALGGPRNGKAEVRLIEIYKPIVQANTRDALPKVESLMADHPNFQLAQLVYGDLQAGRNGPTLCTSVVGAVPGGLAKAGAPQLTALLEEANLRLPALRERPPTGYERLQFFGLSPQNRHVIKVDTFQLRICLFKNKANGLKLLAHYCIYVARSGIEQEAEGDQRTPLSVYFMTSNLDPNSRKDFYDSGESPINCPNQLDMRRSKIVGGIWLHGRPHVEFSRALLFTDGCVAMANPDMEHMTHTVEIRTTPVVIAQSLEWNPPEALSADSKSLKKPCAIGTPPKPTGTCPGRRVGISQTSPTTARPWSNGNLPCRQISKSWVGARCRSRTCPSCAGKTATKP